jgi:ribosome biogenesis GTPase
VSPKRRSAEDSYDHVTHEDFDRPRRRTRPRTKDRPTYDDAVEAMVVTVDRGRFTVRLSDDPDRLVLAMKSRPLGRKGVVVGDRVRLVGDTSGDDGSLARIVEVSERETVLRRTADDDDPVERVVVANADQLVMVVALADPEPRTGFIDRAVAAAYDAGIDPLLCLTKADLADPGPLVEVYRPLDVPYVVTQRGADVAPVLERLTGRTSVMLGHSGVGKSTLVNALVPGADRAVGVVNDVTGRGRHTSTSALMLRLPDTGQGPGWIVDTPGFRSFGLAHLQPDGLLRGFPDLEDLTADCPRGCTHAESEPECALDDAVTAGTVEAARVSSYRRLLSSRTRASD